MMFGEEEVDALDGVTMLDFLRAHGASEALIDWWWRFAAMVVTNVPLERCSAASLLRIHAQLSGYRGLHFGFAMAGLGELYTLQATRVIEEAGGKVRTDAVVTALAGEERALGVVLADGERIDADVVVSAVPPQDLAPLLAPRWRTIPPFDGLGGFEPSPYISSYLWFDRDLGMDRFVSHLWSPERLNYDFYDLCQIRKGWRGRPTIVAANIIHSHRAHGMTDADIVRATVAEIAEFAPAASAANVVHADVHRIPMAIPCPLPGFERRRPVAASPLPGLVLAGDWTRTHMPCTMEGAVKSGMLAAEAVLQGKDVLAIPSRPYDGLAGIVRTMAAHRRGVGPAPE
jgi:15-cis-phytoene desaturase